MLALHAVSKPMLGVLVSTAKGSVPLSELSFCRRLIQIGRQLGIHVAAFNSESIHPEAGRIDGFVHHDGAWRACSFPLPDIIYNRCCNYREGKTARSQLLRMASILECPCTFLSGGLPGKWGVYSSLRTDPLLSPYLPLTMLFNKDRLRNLLSRQQGVFLKPQSGMQGKGTLCLQEHADSDDSPFSLQGRDHSNQTFFHTYSNFNEAYDWISAFIRERPYIIQPFLDLHSSTGRPYDVRALVQKDGTGEWKLTGTAVREGEPGSLTSNLHGGGTAREVAGYLQNQFGTQPSHSILKKLNQLSMYIPPVLEARYGRLGELGIDFGIDRSGQLWILEINSKPGRAVFTEIGDRSGAIAAAARPLLYARYLMRRHCPAAIHTGTIRHFPSFQLS
ncbi:YheC/YheD family protein [Paenibacillus sp. P96]|uniref:YheC/YheD family protein n=1 Tax=Paenibacillus zeirhizosphaerae TaxID=2987519 RepID=A0ABT9FT33_9BACL|nr:YheC/YheD family protein [Paenibacillus sp. P96]MDP4097897.1 YheC/YheD family protein [Paenibacillus sp. P96]